MHDYGPSTYGDRIADIYDEYHAGLGFLDTDATVETLADLAGGGPVLELAIGTGRLAVPLVESGLEVHGIDASEKMVAKLREKPGGERIPVTMGNFADVPVEGRYPLVVLAFNTLFALPTQEEQLRCFQHVADHLTDGGLFVIDAFVPDPGRFDRGQRTSAQRVEIDAVYLDFSRHDAATQTVDSLHAIVKESGIRFVPIHIRYAWPSELDLMAQLAGLRLRDRWGSWKREPFDSSSRAHVSVYEKGQP